jgi:prepilin-type N-terminal cleavage/methylation domain-containing protein
MKTQNKPIPLSGTSLGNGRNRAFTLVELIIVITILAILATIGFMSYQSYTSDSRDANRTTSIKSAQD